MSWAAPFKTNIGGYLTCKIPTAQTKTALKAGGLKVDAG
jgi:hypothetical protein